VAAAPPNAVEGASHPLKSMRNMIALLLALFLSFPALHGAAETVPRPNVLFISVDDLNDWINLLGGHPRASQRGQGETRNRHARIWV